MPSPSLYFFGALMLRLLRLSDIVEADTSLPLCYVMNAERFEQLSPVEMGRPYGKGDAAFLLFLDASERWEEAVPAVRRQASKTETFKTLHMLLLAGISSSLLSPPGGMARSLHRVAAGLILLSATITCGLIWLTWPHDISEGVKPTRVRPDCGPGALFAACI